jgi:hypothetical protein
MRIPLLMGPIRHLATWAHVRWPWSALGRLCTSFVGPLDIPVVCGNPLFRDWGFPVETRLDSNSGDYHCSLFLTLKRELRTPTKAERTSLVIITPMPLYSLLK